MKNYLLQILLLDMAQTLKSLKTLRLYVTKQSFYIARRISLDMYHLTLHHYRPSTPLHGKGHSDGNAVPAGPYAQIHT